MEVEFEQDATGPVRASSTSGNVGVKVGSAFTDSLQCSTTNGRIHFSDPKERASHSNIQGNSGSVTLPGAGDSVLETTNGIDFETVAAAVFSSIANIGPGFGEVGPTDTYAHLRPATQLFLALLMVLGRLELYALLVLFVPGAWRKY